MKLRLLILLSILNILCFQKIMAQGLINTDSMNLVLSKIKNPNEKVDLILTFSLRIMGEHPEIALRYSQTAYTNSITGNYLKGEINSLITIGKIYIYTGNFAKALEYTNKALLKSEKFSMNNETAEAQSGLALIYQELGDYEKNAFYDFENLKYYEQIHDSLDIEITLGNIGIDFINQKDFKRALEYLNRSLQMAIKLKDPDGIAYQHNSIANVYFEYLKDFDSALINFREALKINYNLKNKKQEGIYLMNIGSTYLELNESVNALNYYRKANEVFTELNNKLYITVCQISIGEYYFKVKDIKQSIKYADSALKTAEINKFKTEILKAATLLDKVYLSINDSAKAYHYTTLKHQMLDSIVSETNKKELYKLELQYNYSKEEKIKQIVQQKKNFWIGFIIVCLVLVILIIILFYSRQRIKNKNNVLEREKMASELNFKNKELAINIMALIKKNEVFTEILDKLAFIEDQVTQKEQKGLISKVIRDIKSNTDEKIWNEFSLRFQDVHRGFYEKLSEKYPDLTQSDLKLCAFLRLNMSSKEISELTGQQINTLETARYRIRKKLGISNTDVNLFTFLSRI